MKLNKWIVAALLAALAIFVIALTGCSGGSSSSTSSSSAGSSLSGTINVTGSDTMVNMAGAWAQKFMTENPDVQIAVKGGGSGVGIAALLNKTTDVADASRKVTPAEISQGSTNGVNPVDSVVAKDGVTIIVNSANAVSDISTDTLGKIYRGEITNWKDVPGSTNNAPIVVLGRDSSSGTYAFINDVIIGKGKTYTKSMQSLQSNQAIVDQVGKDANAVGYVGLGYDKPTIKVLTVDGTKADIATVLDGTYALSRDLNMYTNGAPTGVVKSYIEWILGPEGQKIVADQGFVPLQK